MEPGGNINQIYDHSQIQKQKLWKIWKKYLKYPVRIENFKFSKTFEMEISNFMAFEFRPLPHTENSN